MACFSLGWLEQVLIYLVIICAIIAILKLLIPFLVSVLEPLFGGGAAIVGQIINIILIAIVAIFVIYIVFALLSCLLGGGGFSMLPPRPR